MMTIRALTDIMNKKTIGEMNMYKESRTPNNSQSWCEMVQMEMTKGHGRTTLIERPGSSPATGNCEIMSNSITDVRTDWDGCNLNLNQTGWFVRVPESLV